MANITRSRRKANDLIPDEDGESKGKKAGRQTSRSENAPSEASVTTRSSSTQAASSKGTTAASNNSNSNATGNINEEATIIPPQISNPSQSRYKKVNDKSTNRRSCLRVHRELQRSSTPDRDNRSIITNNFTS